MEWWSRWRADLAKPEAPTGREEVPFLVASALTITVGAQHGGLGSPAALLLLAPAVLVLVLRGLVPRMPAEVFAAVVIASVTLAVWADIDLQVALFLSPIMVLYVSWHLGSLSRAVVITAVAAAGPGWWSTRPCPAPSPTSTVPSVSPSTASPAKHWPTWPGTHSGTG